MTAQAASADPTAESVARRVARVHSALYLVGYGGFVAATIWATWNHGVLAGIAAGLGLWTIVAGPVIELSTEDRFRVAASPSTVREPVRSFEFPLAARLVARGEVLDEWETDDARVVRIRVNMLRVFSGEYELRATETDDGALFTLSSNDERLVEATAVAAPADDGSLVTLTVRRCKPARPRRLLAGALTSRIERGFWGRNGFEYVDSETNVGLWHLSGR